MVEKWPIYFLPSLFGCLNGFLFSNQRTAGRRTLEGRASAEKRKAAGAAGSRLAGSVIRGPFHVTGPGVNVPFLRGASGTSTE